MCGELVILDADVVVESDVGGEDDVVVEREELAVISGRSGMEIAD